MLCTGRGPLSIPVALVLLATSCGGGDDSAAPESTENSPVVDDDTAVAIDVPEESRVGATGTITVLLDDTVLRLAADGSAEPIDLSAALDEVSDGDDSWVVLSRDGEWLMLDTERFGCQDWSCLVVARADLSEASAVTVGGELVHPQDWGAISDDGSVLVITTDAGDHNLDLAVLHRSGEQWATPVVITDASPHAFNERGRLVDDGSALLFDCGPTQYGQEGTGICRVSLDGTGFEQIVSPADGVDATSSNAARSADEAPDGSIVFEADWGGNERLWRRSSDGTSALISGFGNDNSPCVLPDGSVASLWLGRDGNDEGLHELKIAAVGSDEYEMLLRNVDVIDVGIHCSN
jgi:hypothetical protein